jgi:ParB/RepB/Spo0J family partition protein
MKVVYRLQEPKWTYLSGTTASRFLMTPNAPPLTEAARVERRERWRRIKAAQRARMVQELFPRKLGRPPLYASPTERERLKKQRQRARQKLIKYALEREADLPVRIHNPIFTAGSLKIQQIREIPTDQIHLDDCNVRQDIGNIDALCDSIEKHGMLEPLVLRPNKRGGYFVVAGSRRLAAAERLDLPTVAAKVVRLTDVEVVTLSLEENIHRQEMNARELAMGLRKLCLLLGTEMAVAEAINKPVLYVHKILMAHGFLRDTGASP